LKLKTEASIKVAAIYMFCKNHCNTEHPETCEDSINC